ncbi:MAG: hypothetical protein JW876_05025 [Candidatus Krumholzibacteriota bacterium]|nr:hypothetical protein [Candidatus Krumholzibacteriota bacterium]
MVDHSVSFEDMYGKGVPSRDDFEHEVVKPSVVDTVIDHLARHRICVLAGRPRSGKTTVAFCVANDVLNGRVPGIELVRYLDIANIDDSSDEITFFPEACFSSNWLLILDNWHAARPGWHGHLDRLIDAEWERGARVLYCFTRFGADDSATDLPRVYRSQARSIPVLDTDEFESEVARGMIDRRVDTLFARSRRGGSGAGGDRDHDAVRPVEEEDYEQALNAPSAHKKIRGNLRFLRWRLASWNPAEGNLRDVCVEDVIETFRREVVGPNAAHLGTIEQIASVAQWEIPFRRVGGENPPDGVDVLEGAGLIVPVEQGTAWRMDSTDAYLFLLSQSGNEWLQTTERMLLRYLGRHPARVYSVVETILRQARWAAMTELVTALLHDDATIGHVKHAVAEGVENGSIGAPDVYRIIYAVMRDFPDDEAAANRRLDILNAIIPKELGLPVGRSARGRGLFILYWMLVFFRKRADRFKDFIHGYIDGYGPQDVIDRIDAASSGRSQRRMLYLLKYFEPDLCEEIRRRVHLKPDDKKKCEFEEYVGGLRYGVLATGRSRDEKIASLRMIDESYFVELAEKSNKRAQMLQQFMQAAIWLSPDEARRIAGFVPTVLSRLGFRGRAKGWSYLLNNTYSADPQAAEDIVDYICAMRFGEFFSDAPDACARMLVAMEKAQPGCVNRWVAEDEKGLENGLVRPGGRGIDDVIVPLALFARDSLARVLGGFTAERLRELVGDGDGFDRHVALGALALCGIDVDATFGDEDDRDPAIEGKMPIQVLAGLYDMNRRFRGRPGSGPYDRVCARAKDLPPSVVISMARFDRHWNARDVGDAMRALLRGRRSQRAKGLERIIMATMFLSRISWPSGYRFDFLKRGHRELETAVAERMLVLRASRQVEVRLNDDHPFVQTTVKKVWNLLDGMDGAATALSAWDERMRGSMPVSEADPLRAQLLFWGAIEPAVTLTADRCDVAFIRSDPDPAKILESLDLPA